MWGLSSAGSGVLTLMRLKGCENIYIPTLVVFRTSDPSIFSHPVFLKYPCVLPERPRAPIGRGAWKMWGWGHRTACGASSFGPLRVPSLTAPPQGGRLPERCGQSRAAGFGVLGEGSASSGLVSPKTKSFHCMKERQPEGLRLPTGASSRWSGRLQG